MIDKKRPDRYEIIGGIIVLIGATTIFYTPRWLLSWIPDIFCTV
jgi:drug/metabolite transporter superfamily protein YnfA